MSVFRTERKRDEIIAAVGTKVVIRRNYPPWTYAQHGVVAQGEVVALVGAKNDARLMSAGLIEPLAEGARTTICKQCRREFREDFAAIHKATHRATSAPKEVA